MQLFYFNLRFVIAFDTLWCYYFYGAARIIFTRLVVLWPQIYWPNQVLIEIEVSIKAEETHKAFVPKATWTPNIYTAKPQACEQVNTLWLNFPKNNYIKISHKIFGHNLQIICIN